MSRRRPQTLAKLARPRLHRVLLRERLFEVLDTALAQRKATCVVGPPGAGKTTLVATWLDAGAIPGIWFQADPGDADLATFFYYLGQAATPFARKGQRPLPLLSPEYLTDVSGFSRRFFRELFARLPAGSVVVLDNYQEVPAHCQFHQLVADAVEEVPPGSNLCVVSRRDPPECYARLIANENVAFVEWDALKVTAAEALRIGSARGDLPKAVLDHAFEVSGGWMAGLTLLLEQAKRGRDGGRPTGTGPLEGVFNYFSTQLFAGLPASNRVMLAKLSFLRRMTARFAEEVTGDPAAGRLLESLYRRHLFVERRGDSLGEFEFHALFRAFLRNEAETTLGEPERLSFLERAAQLLWARRQPADCFGLLLILEDWEGIRRLVTDVAPDLLGEGRSQTLREWIAALPDGVRASDPWMSYWLGRCLLGCDPETARNALLRAWEGFGNVDYLRGRVLTASALLDSYYFAWREDRSLDLWLARLDALLEQDVAFASEVEATYLHMSIVAAAIRRRPDHPRLPSSVRALVGVLRHPLPLELAVNAAATVLNYIHFVPDLRLLDSVTTAVGKLAEDPALSAPSRIHWHGRLSFCLHRAGNHRGAVENATAALAIAQENGLTHFSGFLNYMTGLAFTGQRDAARAAAALVVLERASDRDRPLEMHGVHFLRGCLAALSGDAADAAQHWAYATSAIDEAGLVPVRIWTRVERIEALAVAGVDEAALRPEIDSARALAAGTPFLYMDSNLSLVEAWVALRAQDRAECHRKLREALSTAASTTMAADYIPYAPEVMRSELYAEAIRADIEAAYVRRIVRDYRVRPPRGAPDRWPWTLRIHTLGRFALSLHDAPIAFGRKLPRKSFAVLELIVASGRDGIAEERILDTLWPDEDGDQAHQALASTVHRLRRLIGAEGVLVQRGGVLFLHPDETWVDAWELDASERTPEAGVARWLTLYRGPFLPHEEGASWAAPLRQRLRAGFVDAIYREGQLLEGDGRFADAVELYERALSADDGACTLYLGFVRSLLLSGRRDQALVALDRLRSVVQRDPSNVALRHTLATAAELFGA